MAVSSSVTGKAADEGYIPLLGDPVPPPPVCHKCCHHRRWPNLFSSWQGKNQSLTNQTSIMQPFSPKTIQRKLGQRWKQCLEGDVP